jgi:hypothetical protein
MLQKTRSCMVNRILSWIRIRRLRTSHESAIIHCNRWEHTKAWSLIILRNLFGRFTSIKRILPWFAASISRSMNPGRQGPRALFSPSTLGLHGSVLNILPWLTPALLSPTYQNLWKDKKYCHDRPYHKNSKPVVRDLVINISNLYLSKIGLSKVNIHRNSCKLAPVDLSGCYNIF